MKNVLKNSDINDVLRLCPENNDEKIFLCEVIQLVRQDMMNEYVKRLEHLAFFNNVNIDLLDEKNVMYNYTSNSDFIQRRLSEQND